MNLCSDSVLQHIGEVASSSTEVATSSYLLAGQGKDVKISCDTGVGVIDIILPDNDLFYFNQYCESVSVVSNIESSIQYSVFSSSSNLDLSLVFIFIIVVVLVFDLFRRVFASN